MQKISILLEHSWNLKLILFCKLYPYTPLTHFRKIPLLLPTGNMYAHNILRIYSNSVLIIHNQSFKKKNHCVLILPYVFYVLPTHSKLIKESWNKKHQKFKIIKLTYLFLLR